MLYNILIHIHPLEMDFIIISTIAYYEFSIFIKVYFLERISLIHEILSQLHFHDMLRIFPVKNTI